MVFPLNLNGCTRQRAKRWVFDGEAQVSGMLRKGMFGALSTNRWAFSLNARFPPLTWTGAESFPETRVEKAEMVEAALLGDVDDFGIRIPQQRDGL